MYNRRLKKHKGRRNPTISISNYGKGYMDENFRSISAARAFLLRHDELCRRYDPSCTPPDCEDPAIFPMIDKARKVIKKADRRNYRRQVKSAARKLMENIRFADKAVTAVSPEAEIEDFEQWEDGIKSLTMAISKALETEGNRILKSIYELQGSNTITDKKREAEIELRRHPFRMKAFKKIRTYFANTKNEKTNKVLGVRSKEDIPAEGLREGALDFPPKIKAIVNKILDDEVEELIAYQSHDVLSGAYDQEDDSGEHRFLRRGQQLEIPWTQAGVEVERKALREREREARGDVTQIPDEPEPVQPAARQTKRASRPAAKPSNGKLHRWEQVVGPSGEDIYFEMAWGPRNGVKSCVLVTEPAFHPGDIILDMTARLEEVGVIAWQWHSPSRGRIEISLTPAMKDRYKSSFLYLVRQLALGSLNIKAFQDAVKKKGKDRKGNYHRKRSLKKRRKR